MVTVLSVLSLCIFLIIIRKTGAYTRDLVALRLAKGCHAVTLEANPTLGPISGGVTALTGHGKLSRRVCVARPSRGERRAPLPAELGAADGPTGRFRADLGPFCLVLGQNRATQLKISPPRMILFEFSGHDRRPGP